MQSRYGILTIQKAISKESWHNVVRGSPIDETGPVVVYKPAGNTFPILHIAAEVLLPVSEEEVKENNEMCLLQKRNALCTSHALCVCAKTLIGMRTWSHWVFVPSHTWWHRSAPWIYLDGSLLPQTQPHGRTDLEHNRLHYLLWFILNQELANKLKYLYNQCIMIWNFLAVLYLADHEPKQTGGGCPGCRNPGSPVGTCVSSKLLCV